MSPRINPGGDLLLLDHGDSDVPGEDYDDPLGADVGEVKLPRLYRIIGSENAVAAVESFDLLTSIDASLGSDADDARALAVDGNREPIIGFASVQPARLEPLTGAGMTLNVGGPFNLVTDLLIEGMPAPGESLDDDGDLIPNGFDNCPDVANSDQADGNLDGQGDVCQLGDLDMDGIPDGADSCPFNPNPERGCTVGLVGDSCLVDFDCIDPGTGVCESDVCSAGRIGEACTVDGNCDNPGLGACTGSTCSAGLMGATCTEHADCDDLERPGFCGPFQFDADSDGVGAVCDNCPATSNSSQADFDDDGTGDACDDSDGDGSAGFDVLDNCPGVSNGPLGGTCFAGLVGQACLLDDDCDDGLTPGDCNANQEDADNDTVGDVCDNCPNKGNFDQSDMNGDGFGDACQSSDSDGDGWPNGEDNCPNKFNPSQSNLNAENEVGAEDGDPCESNDNDKDGWPDPEDNCPNDINPSQYDSNGDGFGDPCQDDAPGDTDSDNDGWPDLQDNCPDTFNPSFDLDGDGVDDGQSNVNFANEGAGPHYGDLCEPNDLDNDGWPDPEDNCPNVANPTQSDRNGDAVAGVGNGDACQLGDSDGDGLPDPGMGVCESDVCTEGLIGLSCTTDSECDDHPDNCPYYPNPEQDDFNNDGIGDLCQNSDGEGLIDFLDNCPADPNPNHDDADEDFVGDVCDNCPSTPNGPVLGTCFFDDETVGGPCESDAECDAGPQPGFCQQGQQDQDFDTIGDVCDPTPVPEPGGTLMLLTGIGALAMLSRRRARREAAARA